MLSGNSTAGEHDWGLATVEADETDESPQVLEEKQEGKEEENEVEEKWTQKPDHVCNRDRQTSPIFYYYYYFYYVT